MSWEKEIKYEAVSSILFLFRNEFNKFSNTGVQMLDSIYDMIFKLLENSISENVKIFFFIF